MTIRPRLLIVEDRELERIRYESLARTLGYDVDGAEDLATACRLLMERDYSVVFTDLYFHGDTEPGGLDVLAFVRDHSLLALPIAMSSDVEQTTMERALSMGATAFLRKPILNADEMALAMRLGRDRQQLLKRERKESTSPAERYPDGIVISPEHRRLVRIVAANREIPAVIYGETGTGKEEIARLIARDRTKNEGPIPFVSVNCAHLNTDLAASLLFGHRKGAFSGADQNTTGYIGEADGGILFLDEIHALSLATQHKLLRVLNDGTYMRLGDSVERRAKIQVVAASTQDLDEAVDEGKFLLDLRTRLTGIDFHLPALRHRPDDLPALIDLYFTRRDITLDKKESEAIVRRAASFHWRGNIRQLYKVLDTMVVMATCDDEPIAADRMPIFKTMLAPGSIMAAKDTPVAGANGSVVELLNRALREDVALFELMDNVEKAVISASLQRHRRVTEVYRGLGIGRNTLDVKRKKYGL